MTNKQHEQWLDNLLGKDSRRQASVKTGFAQSTIARQLNRGALSPEMVIALSRAYGRSPVTGLIETGFIFDYETAGIGIDYALDQATNSQLLEAVLRRSDPEARELFGAQSNPNVVDLEDDVPTELYAVADSSEDEEEGDPGDYDA